MNINFDSKCCLYFFVSPKKATRKRCTTHFRGSFDEAFVRLCEQQWFPDEFLNGNTSFLNSAVGYDILYNSKYYSR